MLCARRISFEVIRHLLVAAGENKRNFVAQHELRTRYFQVPDVNRDVLGLSRAAEHMDDFEVLAQLD